MINKEKMNEFKEEDFGLFRSSFESGRQSPRNIAKLTWLMIFPQFLLCLVLYVASNDSSRFITLKQGIMNGIFLFTLVLIVLLVIYSVPYLYKKQEHIQFRIFSLGYFNNIVIIPYFSSMFFLVRENNTPDYIYFIVAILLILFGLGMFYMSLHLTFTSISNGYFARESIENNYNSAVKKEKNFKSKLPGLVFGGAGLLLVFGSSPPFVDTYDREALFLAVILLLAYFLGIHIVTMNLIAIYCKERFRSFNFSEEGHLYPWGSGDRLENKNIKK